MRVRTGRFIRITGPRPGNEFSPRFPVWGKEYSRLFVVIICFLLAGSLRAEASDTSVYTLGLGDGEVAIQAIQPRVAALYARAGLGVRFVRLPHNRSLIQANAGELDGEAGRIPLDEAFPNLIRIKIPVLEFHGAAYTANPAIRSFSPDLFEKYRSGHVLGVLWAKDMLAGKDAVTAMAHPALLRMLVQDRLDIALMNDTAGYLALAQLGEAGSAIRCLPDFHVSIPIYTYVHKKHAAFVPRLENAMKAILSDGGRDTADARNKVYTFYSGLAFPVRTVFEHRLEEAFCRMGRTCRVVFTGSAQRALVMADQQGDGDLIRLADITTLAPENTRHLLVVPESIGQLAYYTYVRGDLPAMDVNGWDSLAAYRNGMRIGVKILEEKMPGTVIRLPDADRLFKMLAMGRIDTVTEQEALADSLIWQKGYARIRKLSPPLINQPGYCLIHKRHRCLMPDLISALKAIKAEGRLDQSLSHGRHGR